MPPSCPIRLASVLIPRYRRPIPRSSPPSTAAKGWPEGIQPTPASDLAVNAYATGLDHPRWLYVLPNGDVLVAETNGPDRPEDAKG